MVDFVAHHGDGLLIAGIMAALFVDMLVLVRRLIIVAKRY